MEIPVTRAATASQEPRRASTDPRRAPPAGTYAALDLGTNNCRLLIAKPNREGFRVIDAFSRIVRLGEGMGARAAQPILTEAAMRRALRALRVCAAKMKRRRVDRARCVATEACRRALNADQFQARVRRELGIELEIIDAGEEAALAVLGCAPLLDAKASHGLIFDIGGGSTELNWVALNGAPEVVASRSVACGVVTLSEQFGGDCYSPEHYRDMVDRVRAMIAPFATETRTGNGRGLDGVQMLGTSGTVTTLTGVHLGLRRYDRSRVDGCRLRFDTIAAISERLRATNFDQRAAMPCIGPDRADLVVGGCAILQAICETWPVGALRVADRGVREGILHSLMTGDCAAGRAPVPATLDRPGAGQPA